jgi:hypothetical protein
MSFVYKQRLSSSPFVKTIWHATAESNGSHVTPADGSWDMIIIKSKLTKVILSGPTSKAGPINYVKGSEYLGIRFSLGTYLPHLPTNTMLDVVMTLPKKSSQTFVLKNNVWKVPEYDTVELLINQFAKEKILVRDGLIEEVLHGKTPSDVSLRTLQRRFLKVTGMTQTYLQYIEKAREAVALLKQGKPILDVVYELGYADQAHMTRIIKQLSGYTPAKIEAKKTRF